MLELNGHSVQTGWKKTVPLFLWCLQGGATLGKSQLLEDDFHTWFYPSCASPMKFSVGTLACIWEGKKTCRAAHCSSRSSLSFLSPVQKDFSLPSWRKNWKCMISWKSKLKQLQANLTPSATSKRPETLFALFLHNWSIETNQWNTGGWYIPASTPWALPDPNSSPQLVPMLMHTQAQILQWYLRLQDISWVSNYYLKPSLDKTEFLISLFSQTFYLNFLKTQWAIWCFICHAGNCSWCHFIPLLQSPWI